MPSLPFQGAGRPLSIAGLAGIGHKLGVHAVEIWTVLAVETSGCGYMPDRRPEILYERHIFHRLTKGRYDDGDISAPTAGGYADSGAHQYDRLALAIAKNRCAALQSCSWGMGQIMGENYATHLCDIRLNAELQKYSAGGLPVLNVRAAQLYLTYLHFHPGPVDGIAGKRTCSALVDFQTQHRLTKTSIIDPETKAQLSSILAATSLLL